MLRKQTDKQKNIKEKTLGNDLARRGSRTLFVLFSSDIQEVKMQQFSFLV
jgi:hypothetical protein